MIYHTSSWLKHFKSLHVYGMSTFSEFFNFVEDFIRHGVELFYLEVYFRNKFLLKHQWPSLMSTFSSSLQGQFLMMFPIDQVKFFKLQDIDSSSI